MATLRPARCYRTVERPWTRQSRRKPRKGYVKGAPVRKIHRFNNGNRIAQENKTFPVAFSIIAKKPAQIRSNALEACRVATMRQLGKDVGEENFFFKIFPFPHHVLRENPLASGAGADRFQTGMRKSFGKPIGTAAQVKAGQTLVTVWSIKGKDKEIKNVLRIAKAKLPTPCVIKQIV
ncbi:MAG: 50S ribosomal protein L16 [Nanoarchaeota archaeon]|nr:50S ribosomal protein L16 [Nanoarchaeota archaeon]